MKAALIFVGNIEFCPYLNNYISILVEGKVDYTVYYWDRANMRSALGDNYQAFALESRLDKNKISKLLDFIQFRGWINKQLKRKNYDRIILLDTLSAFIVRNNLRKDRYVLEIRDFSYENYGLFKRMEKRLVDSSYCTFVSSPGFYHFLPNSKQYILVHNISNAIERENDNIKKNINECPIRIVWAGLVRYYLEQIFIISQLKNDSRIELYYHGSGPQKEKLERYCMENGIKNVFFTGHYDENNKQKLYEKADFILNAYDPSVGYEVKYALSNRFYDSVMMKLPQIVEEGSYKAELVRKNDLGIIAGNNLKEDILDFFENYDRKEFAESCGMLYRQFLNDNDIVKDRIVNFLE